MAERRETRPVRTKLNPQHELSENVRLRSENEMLRITNAQLANELAVARASARWWKRLAKRTVRVAKRWIDVAPHWLGLPADPKNLGEDE